MRIHKLYANKNIRARTSVFTIIRARPPRPSFRLVFHLYFAINTREMAIPK